MAAKAATAATDFFIAFLPFIGGGIPRPKIVSLEASNLNATTPVITGGVGFGRRPFCCMPLIMTVHLCLKMVLAIGLLSALAWGLLEIASDLMENIWPWLRRMSRLPEKRQEDEIGVPVWIVGSFERVMAFAFVLFLAPKDAFTLLGFWIGAKLAASWHRVPQEVDNKKNRDIRAGTLAALIAGIISVSFGVLIGLGIRWVFESHLIDDAISRE